MSKADIIFEKTSDTGVRMRVERTERNPDAVWLYFGSGNNGRQKILLTPADVVELTQALETRAA